MSITIEILQLFTFRATDVDDLFMNTLGTLLGYFIGAFIVRKADVEEAENDAFKLVIMIGISILVVVFVNNPLMKMMLSVLGEI